MGMDAPAPTSATATLQSQNGAAVCNRATSTRVRMASTAVSTLFLLGLCPSMSDIQIYRQSLLLRRLKCFVVVNVQVARRVLLDHIDTVAENYCKVGIHIPHVNELDTNRVWRALLHTNFVAPKKTFIRLLYSQSI